MFLLFTVCHLFADDKTLVWAFTDYFPYMQVTKENACSGSDVEMMNRIAEKLGVKYTTTIVPIARGLEMMRTGKADIMLSLQESPERDDFITFVNPAYTLPQKRLFVVLKGNANIIKKYDDLKLLKIGVQRTRKYFQPFDSDTAIEKIEMNNYDTAFDMLNAKRFDAFAVTEFEYKNYLKSAKIRNLVEFAEYYYETPSLGKIGISKKSSFISRIPEIERALKELIQTKELEKIYAKYMNF